MKEYISINSNVIRGNAKHGTVDPPIRIARGHNDKHPRYANEVNILGPSKLIYSPTCEIMSCGARLVLETEAGCVEIVR